MNLVEIKNLLQDISQFEILGIIDNSASHSNHKGVENIDYPLTHIEIKVLNHNNLNRIDIHRQIYNKLDKQLKKGLHSIEINILKS